MKPCKLIIKGDRDAKNITPLPPDGWSFIEEKDVNMERVKELKERIDKLDPFYRSAYWKENNKQLKENEKIIKRLLKVIKYDKFMYEEAIDKINTIENYPHWNIFEKQFKKIGSLKKFAHKTIDVIDNY